MLGLPPDTDHAPLSLSAPGSRCPACGHAIRWHENIPVLGWLKLGGKCSACKAPIAARYPLVELATGLLFAAAGWRFGATPTVLLWCGFIGMLIAMSGIDWDTTLLPDNLTLPLLWAGLIAAALGWTVPLPAALWGAVAGYLSLWSIYRLFKLLTGKEGMGHGDFKLLAALGAWLGWQMLLPGGAGRVGDRRGGRALDEDDAHLARRRVRALWPLPGGSRAGGDARRAHACAGLFWAGPEGAP